MRPIPVKDLQVPVTLAENVYHESGTILHESGETLTRRHLDALLRSGVGTVFAIDPADPQLLFKVNSLRGYYRDTIYIRKNAREGRTDQVVFYRRALGGGGIREIPELVLDEGRIIRDPAVEIQPQEMDRVVAAERLDVRPSGPGLREHVRPRPVKREKGDVESYIGLHHDAIRAMREIFQVIRARPDFTAIEGEAVGGIARQAIKALLGDRDLLLNLVYLKTLDDYLIGHSVNVCLLAVNIATAMDYAPGQVLEVAFGALLQDVGMLRVPVEILLKPGRLSPSERREIEKHPFCGLDILQRFRGIPASTPWIAYHSHERMDGSGYNRQRVGPLIHRFARIVAVADVYEALISPRAYREARLPYHAMEEIIKMGHKRKLDPEVIRAFLCYISLYPIGSWVELSDGRIGRVVAANEEIYDRPVVNVIYDTREKRLIPPREVNLLEDRTLRVVGALDGKALQKELMDGF
ncbi:MAG: HD-GYP domain-containing protein [Planctomycetota bacterium]